MGNASPPINIMGALLIDAHADWAVVALAFEESGIRDQAQAVFEANGIPVLEQHGGGGRRRHVDTVLDGQVLRGDAGRG
jgi:glucose/arabinose dehydrogenase